MIWGIEVIVCLPCWLMCLGDRASDPCPARAGSSTGPAGTFAPSSRPARGLPYWAEEEGCPLRIRAPEKAFTEINGVRQGMFIQYEDVARPVLLFLHGGLPEYFLTERHPTGLERDFTVVWWDQRGAGLSYQPGIPPETMSSKQFIADTLAVTNYLRDRFGKDKIYLMAHSGGSFFGIQAAAQSPELYHAYIGVAQMVYQLRSEVLAYEYMLGRFRQEGDTKMVRRLEAAPVTMADGAPPAYLALRDRAMHPLGVGTMHEMRSVLSGVIWPSLTSRLYTPGEKIKLWRGKFSSGVSALWDEMLATDLMDEVTDFALPVYFFHGIFDYTVSYRLAKSYFDKLTAPLKGFYTFDRSAHSPVLEEPERARRIMREDVLAAADALADGPRR
jgi:pimeloyl-ACP methyl ester carboxylesterase